MPWLTGTAFWVFKDFSTPLRPDNPVPYVNQKGVVERDLTKKEAYYVFQSYWTKQPMIHIYGHNWRTRWGKVNEEKRDSGIFQLCSSRAVRERRQSGSQATQQPGFSGSGTSLELHTESRRK